MIRYLKLLIAGRNSVVTELAGAKREAMKLHGRKSFISGSTKNIEGHHMFDVARYPLLAFMPWNIVPMTKQEHADYHAWMGGTHVSCTPFSLFVWVFFVKRRWIFWMIASCLVIGSILLSSVLI